ncbi:WD40-repeat-containing domain protein [Schizothecium vesticola]|uniref:WD40-repeat-containing domain protein n=1 Tax=Schizothecium vesticola TaxID=314040 RepID=A0AA40KDC0_9PEZI|nr:WD40-repeat-containing domain protein [Schizothecium vesticola]
MSNPSGQGPAGQPGPGGSYGSHPPSSGGPSAAPAGSAPAPSAPSAQNLNQIVTDYLKKKGFTKTEAVFRQETAHLGPDGRPAQTSDFAGPKQYMKGWLRLKGWIESNLDIYKFELRKLLWPVFVYSYLELIEQSQKDDAEEMLRSLRNHLDDVHHEDMQRLTLITLPEHIKGDEVVKLYRENKYRIPLNQSLAGNLFHFLEREADNGGAIVTYILQTYCQVDVIARGPIEPFSFEAMVRRGQQNMDEVDAMEGIPGVFTGVTNKDLLDSSTPLKLGPMPMELELREDVRAELDEHDQLHPPADGVPTLVEEFDRKIKREDSPEAASRAELPLPPSRGRDVVMEMQKVRENRDRFKIEGRTGGAGIPVSACMFTFHNTLGSVTCMDFSNDNQLVAMGTVDSYIRVWTLDGKPLNSAIPGDGHKVNNRKLIGHSGPVYGVSFGDSIANLKRNIYEDEGTKPDTSTKLLLSCSSDRHVRLWSLETWSCLCIYKSHDGPVFRVLWGPHGHYFATAGWDKTVRIFTQDHISAQRLMVGHDTSVAAIAWHPNGTYVFSASDDTDKSIRMWSVVTGNCVRIFTGHTDNITSLQCAPNGTILASGDTGGNIIFWDIAKGIRIKRCRGHGKGGIPSMSFSAESTVLVSGGLDGTVRLWDVKLPDDPAKTSLHIIAQPQIAPQAEGADAENNITVASGSGPDDRSSITVGRQLAPAPGAAGAAAGVGAAGGGGGKKKTKEVQITPDQISAFPTKKTPVLKVRFTRMNLVVAGGCYDPAR